MLSTARQNVTVGAVATRPLNAAYRAVAFTGSAPDVDRERTCSWIAVQNCLILTQGWPYYASKQARMYEHD
ncbi:hypothetical protein Taro_026019 [Colocasia esculenta]|uniref:Uncharacterized protein n=1 Tax=Colocasia esculenta TaxID=4460 RepID=A0A843VJC1_COLES|nr:hypothetical protein [Colocasia esculenta]